MAALSATGRGRNVEPVIVWRRTITMRQIERHLAALQKGDLHQPSLDRQRAQILLDIGAADHVEDHVDPPALRRLLDDCCEILLAIIDRPLGAELDADGAFLRTAGGRENPRAKRTGELDRGRADAARPAMHEKTLAGREVAAIEHIAPYGEEGLGQPGRVD